MRVSFKVLISICLFVILSLSTVFASETNVKSIEVSGVHTISVSPDTAIINVNLAEYNKTSKDAKENLILKSKKFKESLIKADIDVLEENITSNNFTIYPQYNYEGDREIVGYNAYQDYTITVSNLDNLNDVIDIITDIEGTSNHYINYTLSNYQDVYNDILVLAVKNANDKAKKLSQAFGNGEYNMISISELNNNNYYYESSHVKLEMDSSYGQPELSPSKINVTATVKVSYEY